MNEILNPTEASATRKSKKCEWTSFAMKKQINKQKSQIEITEETVSVEFNLQFA